MTTTISLPVQPVSKVTPAEAAAAAAAAKATEQKDMFLKLLVAQMKNQDPSSPMDQKDMMAQMAQFTSVEQLTNMTSALTSMQSNASLAQSVSMIGKTVDYLDAQGSLVTGQMVTSVTSAAGVSKMVLANGQSIGSNDIVRVGAAAPADTSSPASPTDPATQGA